MFVVRYGTNILSCILIISLACGAKTLAAHGGDCSVADPKFAGHFVSEAYP